MVMMPQQHFSTTTFKPLITTKSQPITQRFSPFARGSLLVSPFMALYHTKMEQQQQNDLMSPFREVQKPTQLGRGKERRTEDPPFEYPVYDPLPDDLPDMEVPLPWEKPAEHVGGSNSGVEEQAQKGRDEEPAPQSDGEGLAIPSAI